MFQWASFFSLFCCSIFGLEHVYLKTPNLSPDNVIGVNSGIRPYRKSGVRLEVEFIQNKTVIHNYGYGGSGLTLCFGGAKEVLNILESQSPPSKAVAVLGAGVIGLATAYDLLERGYEVHLYADAWSPNLTSDVAAGIWSPLFLEEDVPEEKKRLNERMLEASKHRFLNSAQDQPEFAGVRFITLYSCKTKSSQEAIKAPSRGEEVVIHLDNGTEKRGRRIQELGISGKLFMEDLYSKVKSKGASLHQIHFENLDDILRLEEPIVINCTSMGSQQLFNDTEFLPVRGQLIYLKPQEGVDYFLYQNVPDSDSLWVSFYPWHDRIILGGVYEIGEEDLITTPEIITKLMESAEKCLSGKL